MSDWYVQDIDSYRSLWFYAERGLMSYFFTSMALGDNESLLQDCVDIEGANLKSEVGTVREIAILNEFDLGSRGFGSPDGALYLRGSKGTCFVFIEAKHTSFANSFCPPNNYLKLYKELESDIDGICAKNGLNSRINGQLELRWRFANALRSRTGDDESEISERFCPPPMDIRKTDRYYWKRGLNPDKGQKRGWRHVYLSGNLRKFLKLVSGDVKFKLLAITDDQEIPEQISSVRLFDLKNKPISTSRVVYWLGLDKVREHMRLGK